MISFLIFVLCLAILGMSMGSFKIPNYQNDLIKQTVKSVGVVVISAVISIFQPIEVQRIDAGCVGLKVDRVGNEKGIPTAIPVKGWVFYNSWTTDVLEYSIRQFHVDYGMFQVASKGGTLIPVKPSFNVYLKPEKAVEVYIHLLKGADLESLKTTWLANATTLALRNATNRFTPDSIFNHSANYQVAVREELVLQVGKYFDIDNQLNPGQSPPESMKGILQAKANAVQAAQQADLDRQTADAQAYTKVAQARGDSAALVIQAAGEAEAIRLKTREISDNYVQYIRWLNANPDVPRVPSTILGGNTSVLLSK